MNCPVWVAWLMDLLCAVISLMLLIGKGSFLIAGYNTSTQEKKQCIMSNDCVVSLVVALL